MFRSIQFLSRTEFQEGMQKCFSAELSAAQEKELSVSDFHSLPDCSKPEVPGQDRFCNLSKPVRILPSRYSDCLSEY